MRFQWQLENVYSWLLSNGVTALRIEQIEIECGLYPAPKPKGKKDDEQRKR